MNGRLIVLVLATGFFVQVWSQNQNGAKQPLLAHRAQAPRLQELPRTLAGHPGVRPAAARIATAPCCRNSAAADSDCSAGAEPGAAPERWVRLQSWTCDNCPAPIPPGIAAGWYRVVSDSGEMGLLEVPAATAAAIPAGTAASVNGDYLQTSGARRWYFIRMATGSAAARPETPAGSRQPADRTAAEAAPVRTSGLERRKYDFSGYVAESPVAAKGDAAESGLLAQAEAAPAGIASGAGVAAPVETTATGGPDAAAGLTAAVADSSAADAVAVADEAADRDLAETAASLSTVPAAVGERAPEAAARESFDATPITVPMAEDELPAARP